LALCHPHILTMSENESPPLPAPENSTETSDVFQDSNGVIEQEVSESSGAAKSQSLGTGQFDEIEIDDDDYEEEYVEEVMDYSEYEEEVMDYEEEEDLLEDASGAEDNVGQQQVDGQVKKEEEDASSDAEEDSEKEESQKQEDDDKEVISHSGASSNAKDPSEKEPSTHSATLSAKDDSSNKEASEKESSDHSNTKDDVFKEASEKKSSDHSNTEDDIFKEASEKEPSSSEEDDIDSSDDDDENPPSLATNKEASVTQHALNNPSLSTVGGVNGSSVKPTPWPNTTTQDYAQQIQATNTPTTATLQGGGTEDTSFKETSTPWTAPVPQKVDVQPNYAAAMPSLASYMDKSAQKVPEREPGAPWDARPNQGSVNQNDWKQQERPVARQPPVVYAPPSPVIPKSHYSWEEDDPSDEKIERSVNEMPTVAKPIATGVWSGSEPMPNAWTNNGSNNANPFVTINSAPNNPDPANPTNEPPPNAWAISGSSAANPFVTMNAAPNDSDSSALANQESVHSASTASARGGAPAVEETDDGMTQDNANIASNTDVNNEDMGFPYLNQTSAHSASGRSASANSASGHNQGEEEVHVTNTENSNNIFGASTPMESAPKAVAFGDEDDLEVGLEQPHEKKEDEKHALLRSGAFWVCLFCFILVVVVGTAVGLIVGRDDDSEKSLANSPSPAVRTDKCVSRCSFIQTSHN